MSESFKPDTSQDQYLLEAFALDPGEQFPQIRVDIADGPWQTATRLNRQQWEKEPWTHVREVVSTKGEDFFLTPAFERDGNAAFCIAAEKIDGQMRLLANDINGLQHVGIAKDGASSDKITMSAWALDVPAVMITSLEIQTRQFNKHVVAKNIAFDPAAPTPPQIVVEGEKP